MTFDVVECNVAVLLCEAVDGLDDIPTRVERLIGKRWTLSLLKGVYDLYKCFVVTPNLKRLRLNVKELVE